MTGLTLLALPDDGQVLVRPDSKGRPRLRRENCLILPRETMRWLDDTTRLVWAEGLLPPARKGHWAVNLLADAEMYARGLAWHDAELPGIPVFNHPRAVARTRRDLSAAVLDGVPGLEVPATHRFVPHSVDDFVDAFAKGGFRFPVLVRPAGQQGGTGLLRVDGPEGWAEAANSTWTGAPQFMTQFEDFATTQGIYHKARVLFIGGRAFVRHVKSASQWMVHNRGTGRLTDDSELQIVAQLNGCPVFQTACAEIAARIGLDFCGLDVGVDVERKRYVLFECNAAMAAFFPEKPDQSDQNKARRALLQTPALKALDRLIRTPVDWVTARGLPGGLIPVTDLLSDALAAQVR
jgi:glutathione synthase/RimK-type ligase-like ATP-grasp enzyme